MADRGRQEPNCRKTAELQKKEGPEGPLGDSQRPGPVVRPSTRAAAWQPGWGAGFVRFPATVALCDQVEAASPAGATCQIVA